MVNKIPSYTISAGGKVAVLVSRSHPGTSGIMVPACCEALESSGVSTDDIYLVDCPNDLLLPGLSRELAKSGYYAAIVALGVMSGSEPLAQAVLTGLTATDFVCPVIPAVVLGCHEQTVLAQAAREAGRAAVEMTNLTGMLAEMRVVAELTAVIEDEAEEEVEEVAHVPIKRARRGRPKKALHVAAKPAAAQKRRGRPRKSAESTGSTRRGRPPKSSSSDEATQAPRRRGRPRKNG